MRILILFALLCCSLTLQAAEVMIAAGAGYKRPLMEVYAAFTDRSGHKVEAVFGNMQQITAQTRSSGRVDLVVGELGFLRQTGLFENFVPLGTGRLVLAYAVRPRDGYRELLAEDVRRIALPDPAKAIFGMAAMQFLQRSGLLEGVQEKLMPMATVPQVSAHLVAGTVDAGFINLTDALGLGERIAGFEELPTQYYDPPTIVLAHPKDRPMGEAAQAFAAFLTTEQARAILARHGL
ncbi:molybdate ABC transporter substrate-binding protein [Ectothiorhodospira shaposhnikovii]|uniref:molybdate ABC transporter substrate-binding protein n=1 Tax=Ectothiorhodospira shaposhnikovii TaxID=1054 RepID=UPI001905B080|nr:molybdate ABC transporter substrate-binding protein [Ectothiorhodospira shaposhnikovii]MBK1673669.1 molybdate ABC transporter substrate-binding protein [Ectothiorhodospira shaposhnikovii]